MPNISDPEQDLHALKRKATGPTGALKKALDAHNKKQEEAPKPTAQRLDLKELNVKQWHGTIQRPHADGLMKQITESVLPWLEISEKLQNHTHMQAQAITLLQRSGKGEETVKKLTKRVASVIALKEDVDDFLSQECERILGIIESQHEKAADES